MTIQTNSRKCLGGSPTGSGYSRLCSLTLAAILATSGAVAGFGQDQPEAAKPAKPASEKKADTVKNVSAYQVHQAIELGGRITSTGGSTAMWDTMVNQSTGARILSQSLEFRSVDTHKTPFFDTLTTYSTGFGGDPTDVARLRITKGRYYDFVGNFRRDRNFFDYNLLDNSLLTTYTATAPPLVTENDSLHLFNTVRRNTDAVLTLMPLSIIKFRAGINHGTHEGPSYSTVHNAGDVQVLNWFRNSSDTYTGGVDVNLAQRTSLSYDQIFVFYKGDSTFHLTGANYTLNTTSTPVSLGVDVLGGNTTCGSKTATVPSLGSTLPLEVSATGVVNQYCTGTILQNQSSPTRTTFPTEQLRFVSNYWERISFNGRLLYTGDTSTINSFNETFSGLGRGNLRQTVETGNGANGQFANNKRVNSSGDFAMVAELNKMLSISDAFSAFNMRTEGYSSYATQTWTGVSGTAAKGTTPAIPTTSMLTPLSDPTITVTDPAVVASGFLNQKVEQNTLLLTAAIAPMIKLTGGWRYKNREITDPGDDLVWHENWLLIGAVVQPSRAIRLNVNYDLMNSKSASAATTSNTFTRTAPNKSYHFRARATIKPAKWIDFAVTGNDYSAKNDDPMVNHLEHSRDFSFATSYHPSEQLSLDFNYAYDDVFASTDMCYLFTPNVNAPLPTGAANAGTCTVANSPNGGSASLLLGTGRYDAPSNFVSGTLTYVPAKNVRFNGGARANLVTGSAEQLNPLMVPGALQSHTISPFADAEYQTAPQWIWHGNWTHNGYSEQGPLGTLAPRNFRGDIVTLGVRYAF